MKPKVVLLKWHKYEYPDKNLSSEIGTYYLVQQKGSPIPRVARYFTPTSKNEEINRIFTNFYSIETQAVIYDVVAYALITKDMLGVYE